MQQTRTVPQWGITDAESKIQTRKKRSKERLFNTDTQYANFRGNPLYQATKRHLKQQINGQKR